MLTQPHVGQKNDKPGKHGKFYSLWFSPYNITDVVGTNSFIATLVEKSCYCL